MNFLLFLVFFTAFCLLIYKLNFIKSTGLPFKLLLVFFIVKLFAGLGLNVLYSKYYSDKNTSDIYKFFDDSKFLFEISKYSKLDYISLIFSSESSNSVIQDEINKMKNWKDKDSIFLKTTNSPNSDIFNSQRTMIRLNSIFRFISRGFLPIHTLFFCFIGFLGQVLLFKAFVKYCTDRKILLALVIFIVPSVVLWSSAALKESIIYFALGLFSFSLFKINWFDIKWMLGIIASLIILLFTKSYLAYILLISALFYIASIYMKKSQLMIIFFVMIISFFSIIKLLNNRPLEIIAYKMQSEQNIARGGYYLSELNNQNNKIFIDEDYFNSFKLKPLNTDEYIIPAGIKFKKYINGKIDESQVLITSENNQYYLMLYYQKAGSYISDIKLEGTISSFIGFLPKAFVNVIFEPLIYKSNSILLLFSSIENCFIFIMIILLCLFYKSNNKNKSVVVFNLIFSLCLLLLIAYTTPISGNIVRYKIPAISFLLITFVISFNRYRFIVFLFRTKNFFTRLK